MNDKVVRFSMGRGKAKATSATKNEGILRRPCSSPTESTSEHAVRDELQKASLNDNDSENELKDFHHHIIGFLNGSSRFKHLSEDDIAKEVTNGVSNTEELNSTLELIHAASQESFSAGKLAAKLCSRMREITIDGVKCRNLHFKHLQANFKKKEELLNDSTSAFLYTVNLLCETFDEFKISEGTAYPFLGTAMLEYFSMILDKMNSFEGTEHIPFLCERLAKNGKDLSDMNPSKMEAIIFSVRKILISNQASNEERTSLLKLLEICLNKWSPLDSSVETWYDSNFN